MSRQTGPKQLSPIFIPIAVFLLLSCASHCQVTLSDLFASGEQKLREGRTTYDIAVLTAPHNSFSACIRGNQNQEIDRCSYDLARSDRYLNLAELDVRNTRAARYWLNAALTDAQGAVARNPRSPNAHALLADIYGAEIDGMFSGMKYGPKANAETAEALKLDPQNAQAWAVSGRKYLYAPSMFGGDLDKAVDAFRKATLYDPNSDENFVWLAIALQKKGDLSGAREALGKALRLNGGSVFAHHAEAALR
jgi:tetratricopeptide (TPR) repeat protein